MSYEKNYEKKVAQADARWPRGTRVRGRQSDGNWRYATVVSVSQWLEGKLRSFSDRIMGDTAMYSPDVGEILVAVVWDDNAKCFAIRESLLQYTDEVTWVDSNGTNLKVGDLVLVVGPPDEKKNNRVYIRPGAYQLGYSIQEPHYPAFLSEKLNGQGTGYTAYLNPGQTVACWTVEFNGKYTFTKAAKLYKVAGVPDELHNQDGQSRYAKLRKRNRAMARNMTPTQLSRFDNIFERSIKKIEGTFGKTAESVDVGSLTESPFDGEEVTRTMTIESRGVIYTVTFAAGRA